MAESDDLHRGPDDEYRYGERADPDDDETWGGPIVTGAIFLGVVLFLFPEPITSAVGALLIGFGLLYLIVDGFL